MESPRTEILQHSLNPVSMRAAHAHFDGEIIKQTNPREVPAPARGGGAALEGKEGSCLKASWGS